ncbi:hypothetical protein K439DRAFT_1148466 [Ramaria rubella]|nr:hypothetical protein K439DRAFT_1148466 [Ramaria rubella]
MLPISSLAAIGTYSRFCSCSTSTPAMTLVTCPPPHRPTIRPHIVFHSRNHRHNLFSVVLVHQAWMLLPKQRQAIDLMVCAGYEFIGCLARHLCEV